VHFGLPAVASVAFGGLTTNVAFVAGHNMLQWNFMSGISQAPSFNLYTLFNTLDTTVAPIRANFAQANLLPCTQFIGIATLQLANATGFQSSSAGQPQTNMIFAALSTAFYNAMQAVNQLPSSKINTWLFRAGSVVDGNFYATGNSQGFQPLLPFEVAFPSPNAFSAGPGLFNSDTFPVPDRPNPDFLGSNPTIRVVPSSSDSTFEEPPTDPPTDPPPV
jgi:hypothetical protein